MPEPLKQPPAKQPEAKPQAAPDKGTLYDAMFKLQSEVMLAKESGTNPHYSSSYATLEDCWKSCRDKLNKYELLVIQAPVKEGDELFLQTVITHLPSGQQAAGTIPLLGATDMQKLGSALTYARRYGLVTMVGIVPGDDDGEAASAPTAAPAQQTATAKLFYEEKKKLATMFKDLGMEVEDQKRIVKSVLGKEKVETLDDIKKLKETKWDAVAA